MWVRSSTQTAWRCPNSTRARCQCVLVKDQRQINSSGREYRPPQVVKHWVYREHATGVRVLGFYLPQGDCSMIEAVEGIGCRATNSVSISKNPAIRTDGSSQNLNFHRTPGQPAIPNTAAACGWGISTQLVNVGTARRTSTR